MILKTAFALALMFFGNQQTAPDIDLTVVIPKNRIREPVTGSSSGGLVGRTGGFAGGKDSAQITLLSLQLSRTAEPSVVFEVQVQNLGDKVLEFPVDPNLAEFEPSSAATAYAYEFAYITLFADLNKQGSRFLQGISLYGSEQIKGSLKMLRSGETVRIRARVPLRSAGIDSAETIPPSSPIRADLLMQRAAVSQRGGVLAQDSEQLMPQITSSNAIPFPLAR